MLRNRPNDYRGIFGTEDDVQELVTGSEQEEELITLVLFPENQEHK